ncbi:MAG TPA: RT0821/Lpp0805 family surface protein [Xanthobacteraceae bacterium]
MPMMRWAPLLAMALWLAACSSDTSRKDAGSAAVSGVLLGNRAAGAPIGAGSDTLLGGRVGAKLDDEDKRRALVAQLAALETGPSGAPVAWRNPETGRYGNVVPGPVYQENGVACREFTHTVYADGSPQTEHGTACRRSDGTWASIS